MIFPSFRENGACASYIDPAFSEESSVRFPLFDSRPYWNTSNMSVPDAAELHRHVPPDWYHRSIRENVFQRFWHAQRFRQVRSLALPIAGEAVDVGCADGVFTNVILQATGAAHIKGVDVLEASVQWANDHWKHESRLSFEVADGHRLPFDDSSFDAAFCMEALEHVVDPVKVLTEMKRVIRPGGYVLVMTPTDSLLFRSIWFAWTRVRGHIWDGTHIQSFTHHKLAETCEKAGLKVEVERRFLLGMLVLVRARKPLLIA